MVKWVEWPSWKIAFQFYLKERDFQKKASFSFSIATLTHSTRLAQKGLANKVCGSSHFMFVFHYFFWPAKLKVAYSLSLLNVELCWQQNIALYSSIQLLFPLYTICHLESWSLVVFGALEERVIGAQIFNWGAWYHPRYVTSLLSKLLCQLARVIKTVAAALLSPRGQIQPQILDLLHVDNWLLLLALLSSEKKFAESLQLTNAWQNHCHGHVLESRGHKSADALINTPLINSGITGLEEHHHHLLYLKIARDYSIP